jgi:hypothetical protein
MFIEKKIEVLDIVCRPIGGTPVNISILNHWAIICRCTVIQIENNNTISYPEYIVSELSWDIKDGKPVIKYEATYKQENIKDLPEYQNYYVIERHRIGKKIEFDVIETNVKNNPMNNTIYNAVNNNCQLWVLECLKGTGITSKLKTLKDCFWGSLIKVFNPILVKKMENE